MEIDTTRFGVVDVDEDRVLTFPKGLLGFPAAGRYALLQAGEGNYFFWLQSAEDPSLAFVVTDPGTFVRDYRVPPRSETAADLNLPDDLDARGHEEATQTFVICNRQGEWLTGNLLGPVVVNLANRRAVQVVLTEKKWSTRQPLLKLGGEAAAPAVTIRPAERPLAKAS